MNNTLKLVLRNTIIAALYIALTLIFSALSYGQIQFRISEILILFVLFNKDYIIGLTLGCLISNIFSPMALYDVFFGTTATLISLILMIKLKNPFIALIAPVIVNALIVGLELKIAFDLPFFESAMYVAAGEALVLYILGIPLYYSLQNNKKALEVIDAKIEIFDRPKNFFKFDSFFLISLITLIMLLMPLNENNIISKENFNIVIITIPIIYLINSVLCFTKINYNIFKPIYLTLTLTQIIIFALMPIFINAIDYNITVILLIVLFSILLLLDLISYILKIKCSK